MTREQAMGQLRHLYMLLTSGAVNKQDDAATGLLGPAIEVLERHFRYEGDRLNDAWNAGYANGREDEADPGAL